VIIKTPLDEKMMETLLRIYEEENNMAIHPRKPKKKKRR